MEQKYERFLHQIHAFRRATCKVKSTSVAPAECMTLFSIQHIGEIKKKNGQDSGVKVSDISEHLNTSKPDVSKKIRVLEEKGYVTRRESRQDKRVTYIEITPKGKEVLLSNKKEAAQFLTNVFDRMGEEDMEQFMRLLDKMRKAIEEELEEKNEKG